MPDTRLDPEMRVRERAYLLWERAGRPKGRADEFRAQALADEARESFPASDPPSHTGITGEGRRDR